MSDKEATVEEWKTVRIPVTSYYKLAELSGLLTALLGQNYPMSALANWAIMSYYDEFYPMLKKAIMNPDLIKKVREKWKKRQVKLDRLFEKL